MAQVKIEFVGDARQFLAELKKVGTESERAGQSAKKGGEGFKDLGSTLDQTAQKLKDLLTPANLLGGALGIGLVAGLRKAVSAATDYGDEMTRLQIVTGSSVRDLAILQDAAGKVGVSFQSLQRGLFFMANEAQTAGASFIRLGISVRDQEGVFKDGATLLFDTVDALSKVEDASQRASLARQIFSRGAVELLPLLSKTSAELRAMGVDGARMAELLGAAGVGPLKLLGIALSEVGQAVNENLILFVKDVTPALKAMADSLAAVIRLYQFLPEEIRKTIPVMVLLITTILALAAAYKTLSIAMTLFGITGGVAGLASTFNIFANLGTAIGLTTLEVGKLGLALRAIPPVLAIALVLDVGGFRSKLSSFLDDIRNSVITPFIEWLADKIRGAFGKGTVAESLKKGLSDAEDALMKSGTGTRRSPLTPEELQKQLALTKLLTQAQIELGQASGNTIIQQVDAVQKRLALQLKEIDLAKAQGQFLLEDAKRVEDLKVTLRATAAKQIDRLRAEELVKELEHNAALEKLMIDRFQTGEDAAINHARVDKNLAEQRLKVFTKANVATLEDTRKTALAIEASETALTNNLEKFAHERFKTRQEVVQAEADLLLKSHERIRDLALEINQDDIRLTKEALEDKLISQRDYTERVIDSLDKVLDATLNFLKASETHAKESAARQIAIIQDAIARRQVDAKVGAIQIEKIEADLNLKLQEFGIQRKAAYKENRETITAVEREAAKLEADFLARALNLDLERYLEFLDKMEALHGKNAKVLLAINADRFRTQKQMYDRDVQNEIEAWAQKVKLYQDGVAKQLAIEAGKINTLKQFTRQTIDNAATLLTQQARQAGDLGKAFQTGFAHAATAADDAFDLMAKAGADAFRNLSQGLSDFVFDAITGAKSMGDAFIDIGKRILRSFLDLFAQIIVRQLAMAAGFNLIGQAGAAAAASSVPRGNEGAVTPGLGLGAAGGGIGSAAGGAAGFGLGSLLGGTAGSGANIGSTIGTLAGFIPGLGFSVGAGAIGLAGGAGSFAAAGLASLGIAAPAALIGNFIMPVIGAIIGALVGVIISFFQSKPKFDIQADIQPLAGRVDEFLAGTFQAVTVGISAKKIEGTDKLRDELVSKLNELLRGLITGSRQLAAQLPTALGAGIEEGIQSFAAGGLQLVHLGAKGKNAAKRLQQIAQDLPGILVEAFSGALFPTVNLREIAGLGEGFDSAKIGQAFQALLQGLAATSQLLTAVGVNLDKVADRLHLSNQRLLELFTTRTLDFFRQFQKDGEALMDTIKRVSEGIVGLIGVMQQAGAASGNFGAAVAPLVRGIDLLQGQIEDAADAFHIAIETMAPPDEVLAAAKELLGLIQAQIQLVQALKAEVDKLRDAAVAGIALLGALSVKISELKGVSDFRQFAEAAFTAFERLTGDVAAELALLAEGIAVFIAALKQAAATGGFQAAVDLWRGNFDTLKFVFNQIVADIRAMQSPAQAISALQGLAQTITQGFNAAIQAVHDYFSQQAAAAQSAAQSRIAALNEERSAIQASFSARREALNKELELARQWGQVLKSVEDQLKGIFELMAPTQPLTSLMDVQAQFRAAFAEFQAAPSPEAAQKVQDLAAQLLQLAKQTPGFDLPSLAFQQLVDEITAALEAIKTVAGGQETEGTVQERIKALEASQTAALAGIDARIASANQELQSTLASLSAQEQSAVRALQDLEAAALTVLRDELVVRLRELQVQEADVAEKLQAILGDKSFEQFIAEKQAQAASMLTTINETLERYLGAIARKIAPELVPSAQQGMDYVPRTGPVLVHRGEMIVPAAVAGAIRSGSDRDEQTVINFAPTITVHADSATNGRRVADDLEERLIEKLRTPSRFRVAIQKAAKN